MLATVVASYNAGWTWSATPSEGDLGVRKPFLSFTVVVSALLVACGAVLAKAQPPGGQGPERYVVVLDDGVSDPGRAADAMARRYGLGVGFVYGHALKGFSATIPEA